MSNFRSACSFPIDSGNDVSRLLWIASGSMVNLPSKFRVDSSAEGCPIDSGSCESVDSISDTFLGNLPVSSSVGVWEHGQVSVIPPKLPKKDGNWFTTDTGTPRPTGSHRHDRCVFAIAIGRLRQFSQLVVQKQHGEGLKNCAMDSGSDLS